jgi:hypothetical protein
MPSKYLLTGAIDQADAIKTAYAGAVLSLFKETFNIQPTTTKAELEAIECDFTGYAVETIAAWLGPMLAEGSGAQIWSGSVLFESAPPYTTQNTVYGWWLETAGGIAIMAGTFPNPISMGSVGQALPMELYIPFGVNP